MAGFAAKANPDNICKEKLQDESICRSLPKPNPAVFNSAGKLIKKHDSISERLSLPNIPYTPGTPKSARSKFVLPSSLSPFVLSPNSGNGMSKKLSAQLSSSFHASMTPLRQGISCEQLLFDNDLGDRLTHSPSRFALDDSSSSPHNLHEADLFGGSSGFCSEIECEDTGSAATLFHEGVCDLGVDMLKPYIWRSCTAHFISLNSLLDEDDEDWVPPEEPTSYQDYFLANFDSIEIFGDGAFSTVYRVRCRNDNRIYAVKKTKISFSGACDRLRKLREVKHLFLVRDSPHCIHMVDSWEQNGFLYIRTELCDNGSLMDVIDYMAASDSRFTEHQIWNIIRQIAIGIHHIHAKDLIHMDLKPANIFIDSMGMLKIGDFGLSILKGERFDTDAEGDKVYMAPEILQGTFNKPADIFSLGLIALELAADVVLPTDGYTWAALRRSDFKDIVFDECSEALVKLICAMLSPFPEARPCASEIIHIVSQNYKP